MTWDQRKRSLFTVQGCSPKTNRAISPTVKYTEKMGPGKSVHYKQRCSLIRGVHYERFHCMDFFDPAHEMPTLIFVCSISA